MRYLREKKNEKTITTKAKTGREISSERAMSSSPYACDATYQHKSW